MLYYTEDSMPKIMSFVLDIVRFSQTDPQVETQEKKVKKTTIL
jgi:hypothetical protein